MFTFDITKWVPRFLLNDKNGYALAKAIEAALQMMNDIIDQGVNCLTDYETMPEWRLDELAWELNCLYDYHADVETKRQWIINAIPYYRLYGTPEAIYKYIGSYFDSIEVEESWVYNGEPYHFRVMVDGEWNPENEAWARKAIDKAKNVRSVLDALANGSRSYIGIMAEGAVAGRFAYPLTGAENWAGRWPQDNLLGFIDESARMGVDGRAEGYSFPYPLAGTRPEINTLGAIGEGQIGAGAEAAGYKYGYPMTAEEMAAGTHPQEATLGVIDEGQIGAGAEAAGYKYGYPMTAEEMAAGTHPQEATLGVLDSANAAAGGEGAPYKITYPVTGTVPQENMLGITSDNNIQSAQAEDVYTTIAYKLCGQDEF